MGRNPDPPELQAAKGFPGKRRSAVAKRLAARDQVATLLAAASTDDLATPPVLQDPRFAGALAVWKTLAPELKRTHRLPAESRLIFVQLCVYAAEWMEAQLDVAEKGHTQRVKAVAGGFMERRRPVMQVRERAFDNVMRLSERFGLTPNDLYQLFKGQAAAAVQNPGLFDDDAMPPAPRPEPEAAPQPGGLIGSASRLRSAPPGERMN